MNRLLALAMFFVLTMFNSCEELQKDLNDFSQGDVRCLAIPINTFAVELNFLNRKSPKALAFEVSGVGEGNSCDLTGTKLPGIAIEDFRATYQVSFDQNVPPSRVDVEVTEWDNCEDRNPVATLVSQTDLEAVPETFRLCGEKGLASTLRFPIQ